MGDGSLNASIGVYFWFQVAFSCRIVEMAVAKLLAITNIVALIWSVLGGYKIGIAAARKTRSV